MRGIPACEKHAGILTYKKNRGKQMEKNNGIKIKTNVIYSILMLFIIGIFVYFEVYGIKNMIAGIEIGKLLIGLFVIHLVYFFSAFYLINIGRKIELTKEVKTGMLLSLIAAVIINVGWIIITKIDAPIFKLSNVDKLSIIYSNAGNLVITLVTATLGTEWLIYANVFLAVQMLLLWSHGKNVLCERRKHNFKTIFCNINIIAIIVGTICMLIGIKFPYPIQDALNSIGTMVGPTAMLIIGMMIADCELKGILTDYHIWLVSFLRLLIYPLIALLFLKFLLFKINIPNEDEILLITFLACITPSASTITQMAQLYGKDTEKASAINVLTSILCIVTMPVSVYLFRYINL